MDPKLPEAAGSVPAETKDTAAPSAASDVKADSSPAPAQAEPKQGVDAPVETAKTPLDIVQNVIAAKKPEDPAPAADKPAEPPAETKAADPAADAEDEDKPQPFDKHPRFRKALRRASDAEAQLKALEPEVNEFRKINTFLTNAGLSAEEASTGYQVMALMKNAPRDAVPILESMLDQLKRTVGEVLPADLAAQVESGAMTEAAALEVSRARFDKTHAERSAEAVRNSQAARDAETRQSLINAAVEAEVKLVSAADPNWAAKQQLIADRSRALVMQTRPKTPEDAVKLFNQAVADVNAAFEKLAPKPELQKIVVVPPRAAAAAPAAVPTGARPKPVAKTPQEVVEGVLFGRT